MRTTTTTLIAILALLPLGCSFYYSSESSVKTLTSPSRSSDSSSKADEEKKEAYGDDVRDFTAAYAAEFENLDGFESGLAGVARRHGITDWEADETTFTAVGSGLRRAQMRPVDRERYEAMLGRDEPAKIALIRRGFAD